MNKRAVGTEAEKWAEVYLTAQGVRIVERNFYCQQGEIDLIGYHAGYLVFFEVKYRKNTSKGTPEEAVGIQKQRKICRVADFYRYCRKISPNTAVRYDVVAILGEECRWYQNAFPHIYSR